MSELTASFALIRIKSSGVLFRSRGQIYDGRKVNVTIQQHHNTKNLHPESSQYDAFFFQKKIQIIISIPLKKESRERTYLAFKCDLIPLKLNNGGGLSLGP